MLLHVRPGRREQVRPIVHRVGESARRQPEPARNRCACAVLPALRALLARCLRGASASSRVCRRSRRQPDDPAKLHSLDERAAHAASAGRAQASAGTSAERGCQDFEAAHAGDGPNGEHAGRRLERCERLAAPLVALLGPLGGEGRRHDLKGSRSRTLSMFPCPHTGTRALAHARKRTLQ